MTKILICWLNIKIKLNGDRYVKLFESHTRQSLLREEVAKSRRELNAEILQGDHRTRHKSHLRT